MDRRQPVACRQLIDELAVGVGGGVRQHDQSIIRLASPLGNRRLNLVGVAHRRLDHFDCKPRGAAAAASQLAALASGLNKMAARTTCGAISLSSSSNFAPMLGSKT